MTVIQPWQKPFDKLIHDLSGRYHGEIITPADRTKSDYALFGADMGTGLPYPVCRGTCDGVRFHVEIQRDHQLHVHAYGPIPAHLEIYSTGLIEHLQACLGITGTVKSGNAIFDRRFTTDTDARDDTGFLKKGEVQQIITTLAPFVYCKVHAGGVGVVRDIYANEDLSIEVVEPMVQKLTRLVEIAAGK